MGKDKKKLKEMSEKGRKSPRTGKHGKRKTTLALEKAMNDHAQDIVSNLIAGRFDFLGGITKKKIKSAKLRDLVDGIDKYTKNIQLLTGKETERFAFDSDQALKELEDKGIWKPIINGRKNR